MRFPSRGFTRLAPRGCDQPRQLSEPVCPKNMARIAMTAVLVTGLFFCGCTAEAPDSSATPASSGETVAASVDSEPATSKTLTDGTDTPADRITAARQRPEAEETAAAAIRLEPFGKFTWRDTLLEAIAKARQIEGAEHVELILLHRRMPAAEFDAPGRLEKWMEGLFEQSLTYRTEFLRTTPALPRPYYDVGAQIEVKPLSLVGVRFVLKATFKSEPGLIIADPQQVRRQSQEFFGSEATDDVPLIMSQVELFPSDVVSPEAHREIIDMLLAKYGPLRVTNPSGVDIGQDYLGLTFRDASKNTLDLYPGGRLLYRSGDVHRETNSLADRYRAFQHAFDEQQRKGRSSKSSRALDDL